MSTNGNTKNFDIQINLTKTVKECPGYISPKLKIKGIYIETSPNLFCLNETLLFLNHTNNTPWQYFCVVFDSGWSWLKNLSGQNDSLLLSRELYFSHIEYLRKM